RSRPMGVALLILGGGLTLLVAASQALPPLAMVTQDLSILIGRVLGRAQRGEMMGLSVRFLQESLPRFWRDVLAAPEGGTTGARLMILVVSLAGAWLGAIVLGWAVASGRSTFGWGMPLLVATGATTILGGGSGAGLLPALALLFALEVATHVARLRRGWEREHADYSDEIAPQVVMWGGLLIGLAVLGALAIPTAPPGWFNAWLWRSVPLPSGIAAIEAQVQIQRPRPRPAPVDVGLSQLPAVSLGQSLQQGPNEQIALRISLGAPLPSTPWPRYWRARVLERYTGTSWFSVARIGMPVAPLSDSSALPHILAQDVEDLRSVRLTLVGLANILATDAVAQAERLPDDSLAALSADALPNHYRILSLPPELAILPPPDTPSPDMSVFLALPLRLPARVRELAHAVARDAATPYDQAIALEHYLRGLPYSYQVSPVPTGGDAVDQFLFEMRQGYCTYYAAAMAVMARSLGIPARIAVGYATGSYEQGRYIVREADAHAWPELYIDGRWLPFEPTPVRSLPDRGGPADPLLPPLPAPRSPPALDVARILAWAFGGLILPTALLSIWLIWRWWVVPPLARALLRLERRGTRAGMPWPVGATLREYAALVALQGDLVTQIELATYSGQILSGQQEVRLARALDRASAAIRPQKQ
ncbi:MAG: transglutaminase domain-containing protein, partial [Oscillochloris sp.]|nr:transglutaminase domain-containing protein [Oscillochloris sp.]